MTIKELKEMIALMQEHGLSELEVEKNGFKVKLKKGGGGTIALNRPEATNPSEATPFQKDFPPAESQAAAEDVGVMVVRSPMVGTFYAAPAPDQPPYVTRGKAVKEGDVLCIIEAMKLMNEIKSETNGRLIDILVENGQPVEFDQPLFKIQQA
jgi:acetyl-CoA carboxylase biotin carboxyl carrier protein